MNFALVHNTSVFTCIISVQMNVYTVLNQRIIIQQQKSNKVKYFIKKFPKCTFLKTAVNKKLN